MHLSLMGSVKLFIRCIDVVLILSYGYDKYVRNLQMSEITQTAEREKENKYRKSMCPKAEVARL